MTDDGPPRDRPPDPLHDVRVIDISTVLAGPNCAKYLADFGADVIKVERPGFPDSTRHMGWRDPNDGQTFLSKIANRGKRTVELDLKRREGADHLRALCATADVLVENFRPGKLEALGLDPDDLIDSNPGLVVVRITGFGQDGPYADRPGFATMAEAMSGLAAISGEPEGAPMLPPIALTDEIAGVVAAFATMVALHSGVGQVVDVSLLESMFQFMGPLISTYVATGELQDRLGSGIAYSVPRNTYLTADRHWVAVSASAESVAERVMGLIGLGDDVRFATFAGRVEGRREIDERMSAWIGRRRRDEVFEAFEAVHAAVAPIYTMADVADDPHYRARGVLEEVDGMVMQGLIARLSRTPGSIRWAGRPPGADTYEVLGELGRR
jgi:crotonobetainyl-CoA:carnitine CoA-transferase CaiB-like acyl-CoA transferase